MLPEELLGHALCMNSAVLYSLCTFDSEQEEQKMKQMQNCQSRELEQDMGKTIPFCRLDGQLCNGQCMR